MSGEFTLNAETRKDLGKGASRRLRRLENVCLVSFMAVKTSPHP